MWSIISKVLLILAIVLLIPTGLVLASQDALPGDVTYPLKRSLENGIIVVASLNSASRAFFKTDFSQRRFKEAMALIKKNEDEVNTSQSLTALLVETQEAVTAIDQVANPKIKAEIANTLNKQIDDYQIGLTQAQEIQKPQISPTKIPTSAVTPSPQPSPTLTRIISEPTSLPWPTPTLLPTPTKVKVPSPVVTSFKQPSPTLSPTIIRPSPTPLSRPSLTPTPPRPSPAPTFHPSSPTPIISEPTSVPSGTGSTPTPMVIPTPPIAPSFSPSDCRQTKEHQPCSRYSGNGQIQCIQYCLSRLSHRDPRARD